MSTHLSEIRDNKILFTASVFNSTHVSAVRGMSAAFDTNLTNASPGLIIGKISTYVNTSDIASYAFQNVVPLISETNVQESLT